MFILGIKRVYYVCDKILVRNLRNRRPGPTSNPGLQNRLDALREQGVKVQDHNAEEFIENSDSDFYKAGETYNDFLNETLVGKIELRHHIVKERYFKENMPNLLTWSEKEQIRHLNLTQPDVWTPERIAESFPVTVQVVKKLLKYPWKPATEQRIARHDATAMRNWRDLKEGHLDIPKDLREHFLKFSDRCIPPLHEKSIKIDITKEEKLGEFEKIIRSCAAKAQEAAATEKQSNSEFDSENTNSEKQEIKKDSPKESRERITLDKLTERVKERLKQGNELNMTDQIMLSTMNSKEVAISDKDLTNEVELFDNESKQSGMKEYKPNENKIVHLKSYPDRIRIPKKSYKKGATYKVDDCFYDHDGKFLYRVLGMADKIG